MANHLRILCLLLALVGLNACMPQLEVPHLEQRLEYTPEVEARYTINEQWWQAYGEPQLNKLVDTALSRNADLAKAAITINKALYTARRSGADLLPEFSASSQAGYNRALGDMRGDPFTGGRPSRTTREYSATTGVSYEVDLWRKLADTASAREWEYLATVEDKDATRLVLVTSTTDFYFELMYLHSAMTASRASIDILRNLYNIISNRYETGKVSGLEREQAAQAVLTEEKRLYSLDIRKSEVENSLRLLLQYEPKTPLGLTFDKEIGHAAEAVNLNVPMAVLANRPDLKAAEYRIEGAFKDVSAAYKAFYPSITLSAALEGSSSESASSVMDMPFTSGAVRVNLPFLQWNKVKWNAKISEADYELLLLEFEKKLNEALNEVSMAYTYYANASVNLRNAEDRYVHARNISDIYQQQYEQGKRELSDWLEAMNTMWAAWIDVLENRYQTLRRNNEVYKTMAGGYESV